MRRSSTTGGSAARDIRADDPISPAAPVAIRGSPTCLSIRCHSASNRASLC